jgi:hypothetical protein
VQTLLPSTAPGRADIPWIAALHPITAFVVLGLGIMVARRAVELARAQQARPVPVEEPAPATPQA